jgi:hypothetical protein
MWTIKIFKTRDNMIKFLAKNVGKIQYSEIFVNNSYAIEYRKLKRIY